MDDNKITLEQNLTFPHLRVLIVDDNADITSSFAMLLNCWEVNVHTVNDGQSALAVLDDFNPHLILLDIEMPGMDGYEVAKKIRQNPQHTTIKLIALTGWNQEENQAKSKAVGFNEHWSKPMDIGSLKELLIKLNKSY